MWGPRQHRHYIRAPCLTRSAYIKVPDLSTLIISRLRYQENRSIVFTSCLSKSTTSVSPSLRGSYGCWRYAHNHGFLFLDAFTDLEQELKVPYNLHVYDRDPKTGLAPQDLKGINPFGTAPYFQDTNVSPIVSLSESGAIVEYILQVYGSTEPGSGRARLVRTPDDKDYGEYLQWLHFSNGSLQPSAGRIMILSFSGLSEDNPIVKMTTTRMNSHIKLVDDQLANNKYLSGEHMSGADIMTVFTLTTMRGFVPSLDLGPFPNVLRYLKDVAERPAYVEALKKGEKGMAPMNTPKVKGFAQFEAFRPVLGKYQ